MLRLVVLVVLLPLKCLKLALRTKRVENIATTSTIACVNITVAQWLLSWYYSHQRQDVVGTIRPLRMFDRVVPTAGIHRRIIMHDSVQPSAISTAPASRVDGSWNYCKGTLRGRSRARAMLCSVWVPELAARARCRRPDQCQ